MNLNKLKNLKESILNLAVSFNESDNLDWDWNPEKIMSFIKSHWIENDDIEVFHRPNRRSIPEHIVIQYKHNAKTGYASYYLIKDGSGKNAAVFDTVQNAYYDTDIDEMEESNSPYSESNSLEEKILKFLRNPDQYIGKIS